MANAVTWTPTVCTTSYIAAGDYQECLQAKPNTKCHATCHLRVTSWVTSVISTQYIGPGLSITLPLHYVIRCKKKTNITIFFCIYKISILANGRYLQVKSSNYWTQRILSCLWHLTSTSSYTVLHRMSKDGSWGKPQYTAGSCRTMSTLRATCMPTVQPHSHRYFFFLVILGFIFSLWQF